jgi:hypothetical protein
MLSCLHKMWITARIKDSTMVNAVGEGMQGAVIGGCRR